MPVSGAQFKRVAGFLSRSAACDFHAGLSSSARVLLAIILLPAAVTFYTDWLWFGETGYQQVFLGTLKAQSQLGAAAMGLAFVVLFANVLIALRTLAPRDWVLVTREGPISISLDRRRVQPAATALAGVVAVLFGVWASSQWQAWLMFQHAQPFGERDPDPRLRHRLLRLPPAVPRAARAASCWRWCVASALAAGAIYALAGALNWNRGARIGRPARRHLAALAACVFLAARVRRVPRRPRAARSGRPASSTASRTSTPRSGFRRCAC